jgi:hypothetical protein
MSQLSDLTGSGRADVIPDYILSKPRILEIGMAEDEFARRYMEIIARSCAALPREVAGEVMRDAKEDIRVGSFAWGGVVFSIWAQARSSLPFLTWLCLRVKHPQVTMEQVAGWYSSLDADAIAAATLDLWGFGETKKKGPGGDAQSTSQSGGAPSPTGSPPQPKPEEPASASSSSAT